MNSFNRKRRKNLAPRLRYPLRKSIALVGLMGSGKTTVGVRLARRLHLKFMDSDQEIEKAAGHTVSEIFEKFGEEDFRKGERRVINRLVNQDKKIVLGTGGGAFMDKKTRGRLKRQTIVIWLKVDVDLLVERTSKRDTRPLLRKGNPRKILTNLANERYPVYEEAHIVVESGQGPHDKVVNDIIWKLNKYLAIEKKKYQRRMARKKARMAKEAEKSGEQKNENNNS
ncbi:shikimate kinase [Pseudemcibacter aquimaris]|uniref:shikimate kinase n=1 Tax=Pseudemcibacter aquimaris TaxID=2857064 RepID=UPI002010C811|nr:shikimate kinase [Pseudemcibacter aquimaris]MCC3861815.1 shikimate kinase [Pseudemcibacter aquimaris]WDU58570.1 shikimate kinase [Pseudemcibacter aquimaris]